MRAKLINLAVIVVVFILGAGCMYYFDSKDNTTVVHEKETQTTGVVKCDKDVKIDDTGVSLAVGKIFDATVTIQNYQRERLASSGTGFIYKKDDKYAYILTNHHVIENNEKVVITLSNDDQVEGKVLGSDKYLDIAVVRIKSDDVKAVASIGTSEDSEVGDTVITVGSPVSYEYRGTVTRGTLSGKNRMIEVSIASTNDFVMRVLQVDAAINPGNSGGPLVNINGEVIGITSMKLVQDEIEGMGFAIPIEYAMQYVEDLENGKEIERPFIGITMLNVTDTYRLYQVGIQVDKKITEGVVVVNVSSNSGADKAGLQAGDIVTAINGNKVSNTAYLKYELFKSKVGDTIEMVVLRNGKEKLLKVTLTKIEK